jgi:hypothetical protein
MQTGQVSVWVPIAVGVIGLIGIIAGQLVNAWREDRRWKRDQQRDELRWQQERDKELAKLAHDSILDWRDRRLSIYVEYLKSLQDLIIMMYERIRIGTKTDVSYVERWTQVSTAYMNVQQKVMLVASDAVLEVLKRNGWATEMGAGFAWFRSLMDGSIDPETLDPKELRTNVLRNLEKSGEFYDQLTDSMRSELGANPTPYTTPNLGG